MGRFSVHALVLHEGSMEVMIDFLFLALFLICGGYVALRIEDLALAARERRRKRQLREWVAGYRKGEL